MNRVMQKLALGVVLGCISMVGATTVQAEELVLPMQEKDVVSYGLLPNPFKVVTKVGRKVVTAPVDAAKAKIKAVKKAAKIAKNAKDAVDDIDGSDDDTSNRAEAVARSKKNQSKKLSEWEKKHPEEAAEINRKLEKRRQRQELEVKRTREETARNAAPKTEGETKTDVQIKTDVREQPRRVWRDAISGQVTEAKETAKSEQPQPRTVSK